MTPMEEEEEEDANSGHNQETGNSYSMGKTSAFDNRLTGIAEREDPWD